MRVLVNRAPCAGIGVIASIARASAMARFVWPVPANALRKPVIVPATAAAEIVLPKLADSLKAILHQRKTISGNSEDAR